MRPGVRIGVDVGSVRIGVARSDATATLAVPVATVARGPGDVAAVGELVAEYQAMEVLVGLPLTLAGRPGPAAEVARKFAGELARALGPEVPVRLIDERLTTVSASRNLRQVGRSTRNSRAIVDQAAAVVIVTYALDSERATGAPSGELVQEI